MRAWDDEHRAAWRVGERTDEVADEAVVPATVDADAVLDGHRGDPPCGGIDHRPHAVGDQGRFGHQAGAERAALDALARAAAVQADPSAPVAGQAHAGREVVRPAAAELQRHRVLDGVEVEVARHVVWISAPVVTISV